MIDSTNVFPQLEQCIINDSKFSTINNAVFIILVHIRRYMHDTQWPEEAQSAADPAVKMFNHLLCKLDYAKIRMQARLLPSKRPYCEECICKANDKNFVCSSYVENKVDCVLVSIAERLKREERDGCKNEKRR